MARCYGPPVAPYISITTGTQRVLKGSRRWQLGWPVGARSQQRQAKDSGEGRCRYKQTAVQQARGHCL